MAGEYKTKWELDDAISDLPEVRELENDLVVMESKHNLAVAIAEGYDDIRAAASREMYRRGVEKAPND